MPSTPPAQVAERLAAFGTTIFTEFSRLALEHGAINLGQGFPDDDGPTVLREAAARAMAAGHNQYARSFGVPALNAAVADHVAERLGRRPDPDAEVTITTGCTEALAASFLGLVDPGDEVVLLEPFYDSYRACVSMAGATPRFVTLRPPTFRLDAAGLAAAVTDRTRAILINTPHNPTGRVLDGAELDAVAALCCEHDLIAITDEVYEHLVYEGEHTMLAARPGMAERTVTLSSLGKTFSCTGWKIGWAIAPPHLTAGVRAAHQFLTFATATPLQHAAAEALAVPATYYRDLAGEYRRRRDRLAEGLESLGFRFDRPAGGYFILADHTPFGFDDDVAFCRHLTTRVGVTAIPPSAFHDDAEAGRTLARFAFCKGLPTLDEAVERMRRGLG